MQMDTIQIRGVDSTKRYTKIVLRHGMPRRWSRSGC